MSKLGVVVIGRNEGERLHRCLESVRGVGSLVYVDSGSTDGSVEYARGLGVDVVELDMTTRFTAARARNAGFQRLVEVDAAVEIVQFVDGDCEMTATWMQVAASELAAVRERAVVCGRLRERHPGASLYNRLCDMEWDTPTGNIESCGGIFMVWRSVFEKVGGFNPALIAGEEPELCVRIRGAGFVVHRLPIEMALHDAAMTRFGQWWTRARRGGHATAAGLLIHGPIAGRRSARMVARSMFWGIAAPAVLLAGLISGFVWWPAWFLCGVILGGYLTLLIRIWRGRRRRGMAPRDAGLYAVFCTLAKTPEALGVSAFLFGRARNRTPHLVEYK